MALRTSVGAQGPQVGHRNARNGSAFSAVHGIDEATAGYDELIGLIFQEMRTAAGMPPIILAARLGVSEALLRILEDGALLAFPPVAETTRIVVDYARLANVDPTPLLRRIDAQRRAIAAVPMHKRPLVPAGSHRATAEGGSSPRHQVAAAAKSVAELAAEQATRERELKAAKKAARRKNRTYRTARWVMAAVAVPMIAVAGVWYASGHPTGVQTAIGKLPSPLTPYAKAGVDYMLYTSSTGQDGMRLIETSDPRSRKSDKLVIRR